MEKGIEIVKYSLKKQMQMERERKKTQNNGNTMIFQGLFQSLTFRETWTR